MKKVLLNEKYYGFEDCIDIDRDISEMFTFEVSEEIGPEFLGTVTVLVTYDSEEEEI